MKEWRVEAGEEGLRLDKYLVSKLNISGKGVKRLLDNGKVRVNGKRVVIAKWDMIEGDMVSVDMEGFSEEEDEFREETHVGASRESRPTVRGREKVEPSRYGEGILTRKQAKEPRTGKLWPREFLKVIYEDRDVIVVDKPAGVVVLTGRRDKSQRSLVQMVKDYLLRRHKGARGSYVRAVHRLDKDTTGVIVLAKSRAGAMLEQQFRRHQVGKYYIAVVEGRIEEGEGRITLPIEKGDFGYGRKAGVVPEGRGSHAETEFEVRERYKDATLVSIRTHTGRTHQIRVHMSAIGHPVVGDKVYGPHGKIKFLRHAIHAERISFNHPVQKKRVEFTAALPADMAELIDRLRVSS